MSRRALISVYDKTGLVDFAAALCQVGFELVASGNTAAALDAAGVPVITVEAVTGAPEMLDGRVKTLHPRIHGGLLADRGNPAHQRDLDTHNIEPFELVVSNLYPFLTTPSIETIDIGGPAMVRAAAKNHAWVGVVTSPNQYDDVLDELRSSGGALSAETRQDLAREAFARTAAYDAAIVTWLERAELLPEHLVFALERSPDELRYGENPHQRAARYRNAGTTSWWDAVHQHSGVALSYLNFYDADAAWRIVHDLSSRPTCAIIKHANPCGVAVADDLATAYQRALECDDQSAFGGIIALNRPVDSATAARIVAGPQADVIIAPAYDDETIDALITRRRNTRLLDAPPPEAPRLDVRQISGGFLIQEPHHFAAGRDAWRVVTKAVPTDTQWADAELAWRICGHVKSNAIVLVKNGQAVGIGAGQQKRVDSAEIAARKAAGRAVGGASASDAFYPFPDGVEAAAAAGVAVVMQPGGAVRDDALIERADELGLAMVLTGERHFLH